eukprot:TRINITY_DN71378_c0_g1_i1.p2 TRINITY_DN71378_c0_g1~~TRINITY_DN71378_c0_g1_i1.p2  ORF type:complete len:227 (-),score=28.99 TRINITY_DN71378_c0_g1_i1:144-824(-)
MSLRRAQHTSDWLGNNGSRVQPNYEWLKPCERPAHGSHQGLSSKMVRSSTDGAMPSALGSASASRYLPKKQGNGKRPDHTLWPAGAPGPQWQPQTAEQLEWRQMASSAVQAAAAARMGGGVRKAPVRAKYMDAVGGRGTKRRGSASAPALSQLVQETPGVEAWDSVSQAPSVPGTHYDDWDICSAETATASRDVLPPRQRLDYDIKQHMTRNRAGWYDWHGGRIFG